MQKMTFEISIHAPKSKVWAVLWGKESYSKWTSGFCEGSNAITDNWRQGTEVKFVDPAGSGMVSRVAENRSEEFMSFEHLGEIKNGVEDRTSDKVKAWVGAMENYTLKEENGVTNLMVEMDMDEAYVDMFSKMWPPALENVKTLAEAI